MENLPKTHFLVFAPFVGIFSNKHHYNLLKVLKIFWFWYFCPKWLFLKLFLLKVDLCIKVVALIQITTVLSKQSFAVFPCLSSHTLVYVGFYLSRLHPEQRSRKLCLDFQENFLFWLNFFCILVIAIRSNASSNLYFWQFFTTCFANWKICLQNSSISEENFSCPGSALCYAMKFRFIFRPNKGCLFRF